MSREKEIIEALAELSLKRNQVGLHLIMQTVEQKLSSELPRHWDVTARQVLRTLEETGLVHIDGYQSIRLTDAFFNAGPARRARLEQPPQAVDRHDALGPGAGRGGRPPGGRDGDVPGGGDGGGDGFREVLSHPFLFSLSKDEFNELLDAI